jgi:hypothetical protein
MPWRPYLTCRLAEIIEGRERTDVVAGDGGGVALRPDGELVVVATDDQVEFWSTKPPKK